ncbi:hypothetical protein [Ralstonia phage RP31]|uniref:Uncharacterized protein n=2 Tax=Ripduovirus RP12 TaxID=2560700 RepID=A0A1L7N0T5_9CAUD|nr:hypothetical protein FDH28_gp109 [Ralstonia phage RP12]BAW19083.1 hypothetical protein [Ralstonia phage RP12]BAW19369.1 hypothetical protein [Ralstonia phage RP31]
MNSITKKSASGSELIGRAIGGLLGIALNAACDMAKQDRAHSAEAAEAARWEKRKQDVFKVVDDAATYWLGKGRSEYSIRHKVANLKADATQHAQRRSEAMMTYTEREAFRFQGNGW